MKDINEWYADKCGVRTREVGEKFWYSPSMNDDAKVTDLWDIKRADCREIIREYYKITTNMAYNFTCWGSAGFIPVKGGYKATIMFKGKTIAEAEIACLEAIYQEGKDEQM